MTYKYNEIKNTLDYLHRLGHIKDFEYCMLTEYIEHIEKVLEDMIKENLDLKSERTRLKAQIEILKEINPVHDELFGDGSDEE